MSAKRILHLLSQRPGRTGSGTTLDNLVRCADAKGYDQHVVVGTPGDDHAPDVGGLSRERIHPRVFSRGPLNFALPGMSDVMPYPSSRFSALSVEQLDAYRSAWREHLARVIDHTKPDVIHSHHVWLMTALVKEVAPEIPVVVHCHATGLRQMQLCPHLADEVRRGVGRCEQFLVLHRRHADELAAAIDVPAECVHVVGAGYREEHFHSQGRVELASPSLVYAGKYSHSKGLPWLLDAVERLRQRFPDLVLHVAGTGAGEEADALKARMESMSPAVKLHGQLAPRALGDLMRRCRVFVLPSFYEGLPLVLVEAAACGCRCVATDLPGTRELAGALGNSVSLVTPPKLVSVDEPEPKELPAFVDRLTTTLAEVLESEPSHNCGHESFTWQCVFQRIERRWQAAAG